MARYYTEGIDVLIDPGRVEEAVEFRTKLMEMTLGDVCPSISELTKACPEGQMYAISLRQTESFSLGVLVLGRGAELPLHDHPAMAAVSKILLGDLERISFDLVDRKHQFPSSALPPEDIEEISLPQAAIEAIFQANDRLLQDDLFDLTPTRGNLHCFRALDTTVILDVLTPNYDDKLRNCNYYQVVGKASPTDEVRVGSTIKLQQLSLPPPMNMTFLDTKECM
jgi:hypothetical protein